MKKTAATAFPYAIRVYNFMAVSDSPLVFDKARWEKTLAAFTFDGQPAIDRTTEDGQKFFDELRHVRRHDQRPSRPSEGLESRDSVLARTAAATVVTDDNMVAEWREVLRFQDPP